MEHEYFVYVMCDALRTALYTGVTNDLKTRVLEHRAGRMGSYVLRNDVYDLVYFEQHKYVKNAIKREKAIKAGSREAKIRLIESVNPNWNDLAQAFKWDDVNPRG